MKRTTTLLALLLILLVAGSAHAGDIFQVHATTNCNTSGSSNGVTRTLGAGTHYVTLTGAYSNWINNSPNGGKTWLTQVRVHDLATGDIHIFSAQTGWQTSPAVAAAEVAGFVFEFELASAGDVRFFIKDGGGCGDNRGAVTVNLDDPAVPVENSSWSTLKATYR